MSNLFRRRQRVLLTFHPVGMAERPETIDVRATDWSTGEPLAVLGVKDMHAWLVANGFRWLFGTVGIWEQRA